MPHTLALLISLVLGASALAQPDEPPARRAPDDPRWDAATGRNLANYAPPLHFDHQSMVLEISIADMSRPTFDAVCTLVSTAVGTDRATLTLDAREKMNFSAVTVDGQPATFTHEDNLLTITLPRPVAPGTSISTRITYTATEPSGDGVGLVWLKGRAKDTDDDTTRAKRGPLIFTQGQANWNSYWFPCHDFPNDRLSTKLIVTAPDGFEVISNGALTDRAPQPDGRIRWTWDQAKPHPAYLVMLAVGKFDVVQLGGPQSARPNLPMPVYGPIGSAEKLKEIFASTPAMIAHFEQLFDEPYPWDKYAQVIVRGFNWGGMENTSATILADYAARGSAGSQDDLISHELVHQWMGDLITCKSWEHLWLNEGWATYGEWLWTEHAKGRNAYIKQANDARRKLSVTPTSPMPFGVPVVSKLYSEPDDTFTKGEDPYTKGGFFLHMLRERLGDDTFWRGVRLYINTYALKSVETDDFRHIMERASGQSLERFFDQWLTRTGMPRVKVSRQDDATKATFIVTQTQPIDEANPAWAFELPIWLKLEDGSERWIRIPTDQRTTTLTETLPSPVAKMQIDPAATVLIEFD